MFIYIYKPYSRLLDLDCVSHTTTYLVYRLQWQENPVYIELSSGSEDDETDTEEDNTESEKTITMDHRMKIDDEPNHIDRFS